VKTTKEISEYAGSKFKYGKDVRLVMENLSMPVLTDPADPAATVSS
jgi:hypothetical protein